MGKLELEGGITMNDNENTGRFPPWSRIQNLEEMANEAGVDFKEFINSLEAQESVKQMASKFEVKEETIISLTDQFFKYGVSSVMGGD